MRVLSQNHRLESLYVQLCHTVQKYLIYVESLIRNPEFDPLENVFNFTFEKTATHEVAEM